MTEARIRESIAAFVAAWNEHDAAARMRLLEHACADDVVVQTPGRRVVGRAELDALVADFQARCPDLRAVFASGVEVRGLLFRYAGMVEEASTLARSGEAFDAGACDEEGRIRVLLTFPGLALPPLG